MLDQHPDLDDLVRRTLDAHGAAIDPAAPEFSEVLERRNTRHRRRSAVATVAVLGVGVGGLAIAADRSQNNDADGPEISAAGPQAEVVISEADEVVGGPAPTTSAEWLCIGYLGTDDQQRELYSECSPTKELVSSDWACTGRQGVDDGGRVRFTECEALGPIGPVPGHVDSVPDLEMARIYTVTSGDYGILVADAFCTTIEELERLNGWSDVSSEFPGPGQRIRVPALDEADEPCGMRYTIKEGDFPLKLAAEFCVSITALQLANEFDEDFQRFVPGSEILIPPSGDGTCTPGD